jgi:DNA-binding SARP family transcriptional activator
MDPTHNLAHPDGEATVALQILQIRLLGEFNLVYKDAPVSALNNVRLQSLLAYLLLHRDAPQPRQQLAYLFWPDTTELQARNNLRQTLHQLRRALPDSDHFLYGDVHILRWREDASFSLDIAAFEHALARAGVAQHQSDPGVWRSALEKAVDLYRGDLLPSCYDEWVVPERERLRQQYLGALAGLVRLLEAQHGYAAAIQHAQTSIRYDPLAEDAYCVLMRLLALTNDRAGALRVYQTCVTNLQRELGVGPSPATQDIYRRLLHMKAQSPAPMERSLPLVSVPAFIVPWRCATRSAMMDSSQKCSPGSNLSMWYKHDSTMSSASPTS